MTAVVVGHKNDYTVCTAVTVRDRRGGEVLIKNGLVVPFVALTGVPRAVGVYLNRKIKNVFHSLVGVLELNGIDTHSKFNRSLWL